MIEIRQNEGRKVSRYKNSLQEGYPACDQHPNIAATDLLS